MSEFGTIREEVERASDLHMVNWGLLIPFVLFVASSVVVCCMLNSLCVDDPATYAKSKGTIYVPPPKKSK